MYEEGKQIDGTYLVVLRRVPGNHGSNPMYQVHCALCNATSFMRIRSPPQKSCGCIRRQTGRALHKVIQHALFERERARQAMDVKWDK